MNNSILQRLRRHDSPTLAVSLMPIILLIAALTAIIVQKGASAVQDYSPLALLAAAGAALALTAATTRRPAKLVRLGLVKSARQICPAILLLVLIAMLSTTWMTSGVVPMMIKGGLQFLDPTFFLVTACAVCAVVSVLTGSSWTTIATIGVAFIGIGQLMGYSPAWVAGAIISGAYFGDKVSPLSDTTVLAASSCGLDLFRHIRFLMYTSVPAMAVALVVFLAVGLFSRQDAPADAAALTDALSASFNLSPWLLAVPALTLLMIILRLPSTVTLAVGALAGLAATFIFQPGIAGGATGAVGLLVSGTSVGSGNATLDQLTETSGIVGMMPTIALILCAMIFGGVMIGSGMLGSMTRTFTRMLRRPRSLVGATVASGLFLNSCTGDQYLSIIIGGNIYRSTYRRQGLADEMLSRSLEDSVSVTSVLIPWNSCGVTQATVLGVATLTYLPCCIFNILSPVLSVLFAWVGFKVRHRAAAPKPAVEFARN
ncbi:MAG: hypothetical protein NC336_02190 [Clostridium sp.]|nr:hypothetical protein [Clostridium sp.]